MLALAAGLLQITTGSATVRGNVTVAGDPAPLVLVDHAPLAVFWDVSPRSPVVDGGYEVKLAAPGAWLLRFQSPGMAEAAIPVWLARDGEDVRLDVRLGPDRVLPMRGAPLVRGEWSGFKRAEPMTRAEDGAWVLSAEIGVPSGASTIRYYIERDTAAGPDRRPNPSESRRATMEHRFVSIADVRGGRVEIRFDPANIPVRDAEPVWPVVKFKGRPDLQAAWDAQSLQQRRYAEVHYAYEVLELPRETASAAIEESYEDLRRALRRATRTGPRLGREFAAAHLLRMTRDPAERKALLAILGAKSPGWAAAPPIEEDHGIPLGVRLAPEAEEAHVALAATLARVHPDPALRAFLLMGLASRATKRGDKATESQCVAELRRSYSDRAFVQHWFKERDRAPYSLLAGKPFPSTGLKTTSGAEIGPAYFSGAPLTVVVFSSPTCGSCRLVLPDLRRLRAAHASSGMGMVTFHAGSTARYLTHELEAEPQPWDHVVLGEDEHPIEKACDVRFFPTVFLVDRAGVVLNRDDDLWVRIEEAVATELSRARMH